MKSIQKIFRFLLCLLCLLFAVLLIQNAPVVAKGAVQGIRLCLQTVIPSLFCFMVLTCFLINSGLYRFLSLPLARVTRRLFFLPPELGSILLLGMVGGYPMGAKAIASLLQQQKIAPKRCPADDALLLLRRSFLHHLCGGCPDVRQLFCRRPAVCCPVGRFCTVCPGLRTPLPSTFLPSCRYHRPAPGFFCSTARTGRSLCPVGRTKRRGNGTNVRLHCAFFCGRSADFFPAALCFAGSCAAAGLSGGHQRLLACQHPSPWSGVRFLFSFLWRAFKS